MTDQQNRVHPLPQGRTRMEFMRNRELIESTLLQTPSLRVAHDTLRKLGKITISYPMFVVGAKRYTKAYREIKGMRSYAAEEANPAD